MRGVRDEKDPSGKSLGGRARRDGVRDCRRLGVRSELPLGPAVKATHSGDVLRFDIVEDPTRFVFSEKPVDGDGLPAYGNYFVTQGYLYPEGTLNGSDGVLPDGKPAFPDKVLGEWTCYGTHLGKGAKTEKGPWVITTQLFSLGKHPGRAHGGNRRVRAARGRRCDQARDHGRNRPLPVGRGRADAAPARLRLDERDQAPRDAAGREVR